MNDYDEMNVVDTDPEKSVLPLLSMLFGIPSMVVACCCAIGGFALGATAVILGVVCMSKGIQYKRGFTIAGISTGAIGIVIAVINGILGFILGITGQHDFINMFLQ
ncbi:MAG: hypothetical protein FWF77_00270 [Defluviitaleaceae bacterium]|nr:hypothetical protein [Defluviitaleaceae bacterium]